MSQTFQPGDFLVFQLEAGFALLRMLDVDRSGSGNVWHVAGYRDFFPDVESAEAATTSSQSLKISEPHIALTNRAFESTQVARISNAPLTEDELVAYRSWQQSPEHTVSDRSVRLILGLR